MFFFSSLTELFFILRISYFLDLGFLIFLSSFVYDSDIQHWLLRQNLFVLHNLKPQKLKSWKLNGFTDFFFCWE